MYMGFAVAILSCSFVLFFSVTNALSLNYYEKTCPDVESIVFKVVREATSKDKKVPATLLRMHFHDCFIRGCDGSVLLDSRGGNSAEKDGLPNRSLHAFYAIEGAKRAVEAVCPGIVSCADVLAFAARDSVVLSGGPTWDVPKGRRDGRISQASETTKLLPSPSFNISQLQKAFALRGLSKDDLVALLGAHTLGFSHCSSFQNRIRNFNSNHDVDPTMHPSLASGLRSVCPVNNRDKDAGSNMDPSPTTFDNNHYKLILQGKALFSVDQALLADPKTMGLVYKFASSNVAFHYAFAKSMVKMSSINGGQEIRKRCNVAN